MLDRERAYFEAHRDEFLRLYPKRFVVIKDEELLGVFNTIEEALAEGARRVGLQPFLTRQVVEVQPEVAVPALMLGLHVVGRLDDDLANAFPSHANARHLEILSEPARRGAPRRSRAPRLVLRT